MKFLHRKIAAPAHVPEVNPLESAMDLAQAINAHRDAQAQAEQANEAVARLRASRIRNGFAPVIEESIIRRYLGSTS